VYSANLLLKLRIFNEAHFLHHRLEQNCFIMLVRVRQKCTEAQTTDEDWRWQWT